MAIHSRLNSIEVCAGYSGLGLGISLVEPAFRTVCYVERETFAAANLVAKIQEGALDDAPAWSDLSTMDGKQWRGKVDLITAGIPCQPHSFAGKRGGVEDKRWLWDDLWRIVNEVQPRYLFLENVPGFISNGLGAVISDLAEAGWSAEWDCFSAQMLGAPQKRERIFILAHSKRHGRGESSENFCEGKPKSSDRGELANAENHNRWSKQQAEAEGSGRSGPARGNTELADTQHQRKPQSQRGVKKIGRRSGNRDKLAKPLSEGLAERKGISGHDEPKQQALERKNCIWPSRRGEPQYPWEAPRTTEPRLDGTVNGHTSRVDRLRLCGNGVVPIVAGYAWAILKSRLENGRG